MFSLNARRDATGIIEDGRVEANVGRVSGAGKCVVDAGPGSPAVHGEAQR
jgi:hypothetical protein